MFSTSYNVNPVQSVILSIQRFFALTLRRSPDNVPCIFVQQTRFFIVMCQNLLVFFFRFAYHTLFSPKPTGLVVFLHPTTTTVENAERVKGLWPVLWHDVLLISITWIKVHINECIDNASPAESPEAGPQQQFVKFRAHKTCLISFIDVVREGPWPLADLS